MKREKNCESKRLKRNEWKRAKKKEDKRRVCNPVPIKRTLRDNPP